MNPDESLTPQPDLTESSFTESADDFVPNPSIPVESEVESETVAAEIVAEGDLIASEETRSQLEAEIERLEAQKNRLNQEISALQAQKDRAIAEQTQSLQSAIDCLVREGLQSFEQQKQALEASVEQLERRRDRVREEMRTTFAGASQDLAIRVQGFKDYLVGSLQDLAAAAEQLELVKVPEKAWSEPTAASAAAPTAPPEASVAFARSSFEERSRQIQEIIDRYRTRPDYYGPPWQLRRTFEPIHAERVRKWFLTQGGRGAIRSMGSRLQNILVASAIISILHQLQGDRCRALILADSPERLGEWRRGLQDCLGVSRSDFGPERGLTLFESPEAMIQKAERLEEDGFLPAIVIDESESQIDLALLQFPLWLAFAPDPQQSSGYSF